VHRYVTVRNAAPENHRIDVRLESERGGSKEISIDFSDGGDAPRTEK